MTASADVSLPSVFSDNAVFQRNALIPVWGEAAPGEKVTVTLDTLQAFGTADGQGKWRVDLPAHEAGGPYTVVVRGNNEIQLQNVLMGEVWFASGQSNMQFPVEKAHNAQAEIDAATDPAIREFTVKSAVALEPQGRVQGQWRVAEPKSVGKFSAVGYFFARELRRKLGVPVGIVHASQGWTPAEAWMSREALSGDPELKRDILQKWDELTAAYPAKNEVYTQAAKNWEAKKKDAEATGQPVPPAPRRPVEPMFIHRATGLWNGAVAPLVPYGIRGVIWYQGETNDRRGYQYRKLFPALIEDWRSKWGRKDMPFLWVQLASVLAPDLEPAESEWSEVREAQAMALRLPDTGMAVTIDIGDEKDVHPTNKQDVGHRLALNALARVYGQKLDYSGPVFKSAKREQHALRLTFHHVNQGLKTPGDVPLAGFAIAGEDREFVRASARIEGETIAVWSDQVLDPVAVRYAWANNPMPNSNLFSLTKEGELLPSGPFRTDDWPGKSFGVVKMPIDGMG